MGKRLIISGADFSENKIEQAPIPQVVEWSIGTISSTGVIGTEFTGIHTNLLDIRSTSVVSIIADALVPSAFNATYGIAGVVALYDNSDSFITRIAVLASQMSGGDLTHVVASANLSSYPTAKKVRFVIADYINAVTNVDTALLQASYELNGI